MREESERKRSLFLRKNIDDDRRDFMSKVVEVVTNLTANMIEEEGFELVDLEFVKEGKSWFLRFSLDKPGGIDIEDCAYMSEKISALIDAQEVDPIPQAYFLEVASPGAERPLKTEADIQQAIDEYVHISFYQAVDGEKFVEGTLKEVLDDELVLDVRVKTRVVQVRVLRTNIAKIRLAIQF